MLLTDTHTHLYYERDQQVQAELVQRCLDNHIGRLFLPNVNLESIPMINEMVERYPEQCFAMSGLHPCDVKDDYMTLLEAIRQQSRSQEIVAVGEIGIDLYWDKSTLDIQIAAFKWQIAWAKELDLPIVIHCREAFDEVFEVLRSEKHPKLRGILHCFTGTLDQALEAIELGFYLGIGGVATYKKAGLDEVLRYVPLDKIVLETDAPYLAPVPFRGKPNESSYLIHVAKKLSEVYSLPIEEIATITTENSRKIFLV